MTRGHARYPFPVSMACNQTSSQLVARVHTPFGVGESVEETTVPSTSLSALTLSPVLFLSLDFFSVLTLSVKQGKSQSVNLTRR